MRHLLLACIAGMILVSPRCGMDSPLPPGPEDPEKNLLQYDAFLEKVERENLEVSWRQATSPGIAASPRPFGVMPILMITDAEVVALQSRLRSPSHIRILESIHDRAVRAQSDADPAVAGLLEKIQEAYRPVEARENLLRRMVAETDPEARRKAWMSSQSQASKLEPLLRALSLARGTWAGRRNQQPFVDLLFQHRGFLPATAERLRDQVRRALRLPADYSPIDPWNAEAASPELMRQFEQFLDLDGCLDRARSFLLWAGLPKNPAGLRVRTSSHSEFSSTASYPVAPPDDVRITVLPGAGIAAQWSVLHEFGHAGQAIVTRRNGPAALRRIHSAAVSEGCAKLAERLAYAPEWLEQNGVPAGMIQALRKWEIESERSRMRDILADLKFESVYYEEPDGDLTSAYVRIQSEQAGIRQPEGHGWALQRHLAFRPLERWDYLLARCAQAAIYRRLRALPGGLLGSRASGVLRSDVLEQAAGSTYEEWFREAAGIEPDCSAWIEDVVDIR